MVFAIAATVLLACVSFWPAWIESTLLRSRSGVGLLALWCGSVALLLHPEFSAGLAQGIREFRKASREVLDEIDRLF